MYLISGFVNIGPFPFCPRYPKSCQGGNRRSPRASARSQHHVTTSFKVGLLAFQFIYNTCYKAFLHILRILCMATDKVFILFFLNPLFDSMSDLMYKKHHQQHWCQRILEFAPPALLLYYALHAGYVLEGGSSGISG